MNKEQQEHIKLESYRLVKKQQEHIKELEREVNDRVVITSETPYEARIKLIDDRLKYIEYLKTEVHYLRLPIMYYYPVPKAPASVNEPGMDES